jgi:hypothetical protein
MGNSFTAGFNNTFGSNITYIANAYSKSKEEYISACFHSSTMELESYKEKLEINASMSDEISGNLNVNDKSKVSGEGAMKKGINAEGSMSAESIWKSTMHKELIRIPYRDFHQKRRDTKVEYLTVISHKGTVLVDNYKILANRSFIITNNGSIKPQKYGGGLWIDEWGTNHYPAN